jgi:hypothetical protein
MLKDQLMKYSEHLQTEQALRDKVVDKGRLAYRMGFELRANPEKGEGVRKLWEIGYKKEQETFEASNRPARRG